MQYIKGQIVIHKDQANSPESPLLTLVMHLIKNKQPSLEKKKKVLLKANNAFSFHLFKRTIK